MTVLFDRLALDGPSLVRKLACIALAAGIGIWAALLLAPAARPLPPLLETSTSSRPNVEPVARWFGGGDLRVRVAAIGLISGADGAGAALLAVNGGPVQAYRVGQALAPGVTLAAVGPAAVSIDQDGVVENVAVRMNPVHLVQGFIPAPVTPSLAQR